MQQDILKALQWRYATKEFDQTKKVSTEDLETLLEVAHLSPSSYGLQPWKFALVETTSVREEIKGAAWGQAQITDASHLLVMMSKTEIDAAYIEKYIQYIAEVRGIDSGVLKGFSDMMTGGILPLTPEARAEWMSRQVYIPVGMLLEAAALLQIDACPMEGFGADDVQNILGIDGFRPRVLIALGYRKDTDSAAKYTKVRFPADEIIIRV